MDRNILEFIEKLRLAGLQISPAESIDCLRGLTHAANMSEKKEIMKATLVKRTIDIAIFEKIYALYYGAYSQTPEENCGAQGQSAAKNNPSETNKVNAKKGWKELYDSVKQDDQNALSEIVNEAIEGLGELKQGDVKNFNNLVRRAQITMEWFMAENRIERSYWDIPYEEWLQAKERFEQLKQEIEDALRRKIEKDLGGTGEEELLKQLNWKSKDFGSLRDEEIIEMERRVTLLGKRLASRIGRRRTPAKNGIIDIKRIMRKASTNSNFIPSDFYYLKKKPAKPKISIMCDISGSVARYSRFMLQMIYIFANRFLGIKAYVFVDEIADVTEVLQENSWQDAFDKIFRYLNCSNTGYSDYGKVFRSFNQKYLSDIDKKTSVVILGDARNNWFPPGEEEFTSFTGKAKKTLWLNPQEKNLWDKDDSIIATYAKYCNAVEECKNLEQLEEVVKKILAW